jgi:hypothetical protein
MARKKNGQPQPVNDDLGDYRSWLVAAEQKAQEDFDKTVLSLSGGALGVSFVFLKDIVGIPNIQSPGWLLGSWLSWGVSSLSVLASFYTSNLALRRAIRQVDDGTIRKQTPGGGVQIVTAVLNAAGALLFLVGVVFITVFVYLNVGNKTDEQAKAAATAVSAASAKSAPTSEPAAEPVAPGSRSSSPVTADHRGLPRSAAPAEEVNEGQKR